MFLIEYLNQPNDRKTINVRGIKVPSWIYNVYCVIGIFAFGAACSQLTTDVMKYTIGRLRPHFYTVCMPNIDCTSSSNQNLYHTSFTCTNPEYMNNARIMKEMRFFSNTTELFDCNKKCKTILNF